MKDIADDYDNAIELTYEVCEDCYTHFVQRDHVTYYNIHACDILFVIQEKISERGVFTNATPKRRATTFIEKG